MLRLEVLCFAGTYGLALLSELARFVVRSAARWYLTVGLTALGWVVQTAYLANLALVAAQGAGDDGRSSRCWCCRGSSRLIGLYLMVRSPRPVAVGLFVLPLVLALVLLAGRFASRTAQLGRVAGRDGASGARCTASSCWPGRSARAWRSPRG